MVYWGRILNTIYWPYFVYLERPFKLKDYYQSNITRVQVSVKEYSNEEELLLDSYNSFFDKYQSDLGHYFRTLYNVFKFVNNVNIEDKDRYTSMIRANYQMMNLYFYFIMEFLLMGIN